jgi:putative endonuclease
VNTRGADAESLALQHLQSRGLSLLARNWHARGGELDLVMLERGTVVIVEVRQRRSGAFGGAAASVDARKQARIVQATRAWLAAHPQHARRDLRFDVVAFEGDAVEWIRSAFDAVD